MGCGSSKREERTAVYVTKKIDQQLRTDKTQMKQITKLLLLGAGESGKSTIFKQLKIIHLEGFTQADYEQYRAVVYSNTIQSMEAILKGMNRLGIPLADSDREVDGNLVKEVVRSMREREPFAREVLEALKRLWKDPGVRAALRRSNEYQLWDSAPYFLDSLDRIGAPDYIPTDQDILRTRVRTTGVAEVHFNVKSLNFRMFDVGGQRSEKKKWILCFEDVAAILFCIALSEYDQTLVEDEETNRMHESLRLFETVCGNKYFVRTSLILFLNKRDLFEEKIKKSPITVCFKEYKGPQNYNACSKYITEKFTGMNEKANRDVYTHLTCATDTENMRFVFDAVTNVIVAGNLKRSGIIR